MKSLLVPIGILLILVSVAILLLFVVLPAVLPSLEDAPFIKDTLQTVLCREGESLTATYATFSTRPGSVSRNVDMRCVNSEKQRRDVTGQVILYGMVGYLVPFLIGLFMVIIGAGRRRRFQFATSGGFMQGTDMYNPQGVSMNASGYQVTVDPDGKVVVKTPDGQVYSGQQGLQGMAVGASSVEERLKELKTLHDSGLITESEYEKKKQEILRQL